MKSFSEKSCELEKEENSENDKQIGKNENILNNNKNRCEEVVKNGEKVDLNALFDAEKSSVNENLDKKLSIDEYYLQNETNREHRHVILRKMRFTRGVSMILALLMFVFFIGIILTIVGSIYMRTNVNPMNDRPEAEHDMNDQSFVDSIISNRLIEPMFNKQNFSNDDIIDVNVDSTDVLVDNSLNSMLSTVDTTKTTTQRSTSYKPENNFIDEQLEDIAPDSPIRRILERIRNNRSEFGIQDIPPALDEMMQYFRRVLHLPRIRFDYED